MDSEECPICLQPLDNQNDIMNIKCCKNPFHLDCYHQCMIQKAECPLCRTKQDDVVVIIEEPNPVPVQGIPVQGILVSISFVIILLTSMRCLHII